MKNIPMTVEELLEAKEGEEFQFKEAKRRFDSNEAAKCCCALEIVAEENLFLAYRINVHVRL